MENRPGSSASQNNDGWGRLLNRILTGAYIFQSDSSSDTSTDLSDDDAPVPGLAPYQPDQPEFEEEEEDDEMPALEPERRFLNRPVAVPNRGARRTARGRRG